MYSFFQRKRLYARVDFHVEKLEAFVDHKDDRKEVLSLLRTLALLKTKVTDSSCDEKVQL